jgi:hypothetical protein
MRKIFLALVVAVATVNTNAQLVVDSLGHVGIGAEAPKSRLAIGGDGDSITSFYCYTSDNRYGIRASNYSNKDDTTYGFYSMVRNYSSGSCYGVHATAISNNNSITTRYNIGLGGYASCGYTAVGVMGAKASLSSIPCVNFAGVYGAETFTSPNFGNYSGTYAGYFKGKVRVTNGIYATLLSPSASPSPSGQNETTSLSDRGESVADKLSSVQAIQFQRIIPEVETEEREEEEAMPEQYLSPVQYGLDAEQLKAVYPELVYEDANGNTSINYVEMVPLLVQSIKELSAKVVALEEQLGTQKQTKRAKAATTALEEAVPDVDIVRMDQNKPNPFSESTVIGLNIPEKTQKANVLIYDLSGKQIQSVPVTERGETNITLYAGDLGAGMYIYTLVVDGKVVVTRRMIVDA